MDELKNCPFCGNENILFANAAELEECENFEKCESCNYICVLCSLGRGGCGATSGYGETKEIATERWNARIESKPRALTLEELQKMNARTVFAKFPQYFDGGDLIIPALVACNADGDDIQDVVYLTNNPGGRSTYGECIGEGGTIYNRNPREADNER